MKKQKQNEGSGVVAAVVYAGLVLGAANYFWGLPVDQMVTVLIIIVLPVWGMWEIDKMSHSEEENR